MDGFHLGQEEAAAVATRGEKRENEDCSWSSSYPRVQAQHRRSKSASGRDLDVSRDGVLHPEKKQQEELHASPLSTRAYRTPGPCLDRSAYRNKNPSLNQRASLEKDIELLQLRLQQEKSMRIMLERAMGRASSTLSPGHRHFAAQTKELITEIELLEEEVANREQHVLSLYRSIFDHCVSRHPSGQSSGKASPARTKHTSRKHPSIISSAFCSSKKFPLRPLQALVSTNDSGKRTSRSIDASQFCGKSEILFDMSCSYPIKVQVKVQGMEKNSVLRTLKEQLYQCPSKLSEEMVKCMATVYCWLRSATSNIEISWISTDKSQFSRASIAISNYRALVEQLEKVTVSQMGYSAQIAFWIKCVQCPYYASYGIPHSSLRRLALFHKAAYSIGDHIISANAIEQSIFCFCTPRIGRWLETILSTALRKKSGEERLFISSKLGLPYPQPLACFALCTAKSLHCIKC
ncbi:hypothetical protein ES332_A08G198500v1 [Gossypium tomentosum]|uniref:Ternary complex factor MIP1 leucine-zipper domain-containing protein n=1 Tax=Gossypium tomentosum TaxID=34277 RepID=A0A5D2PI40_GOSTO|nr:hypothetical protein ES332_A08G198500v1 [Gossypium tomentosum]